MKAGLTQLLHFVIPQDEAMIRLRAQWGRPGTREGWRASEYFDLVRDRDAAACVEDKTFTDLEMDAIFSRMDATVTPVGSQVLFRHMRHYENADELAKRYSVYGQLQANAPLREQLQRKLLPLKHEPNAAIADFIFGESPPKLTNQHWLGLQSLLSIVAFAGFILLAWPVWIWLAMLLANTVTLFHLYGGAQRGAAAIKDCLRLVKVADHLASSYKKCPSLPQLASLAREQKNRNRFGRMFRWRALLDNPFTQSVVALLNGAFLLELLWHVRDMKRFARVRHKLSASFQLVGEIDAAIAIASWLASCSDYCRPTLTDRPELEVRKGLHPLVANGIPNSVLLDQRSVLVTGSNMAGKTTFIKMIGVNALLAQTLGFCMAAEATLPRAHVMASIQARHSVGSGKSHYFSEVETIRALLAQKERTVLVIDELFSGTNTVERVAIVRAVLESLSHHSLVLATTHDVELQAVLKDHYDLYHFRESPEVDGFFDYRLRRGATTERNAIRLLKEMDYPDDIIANAIRYADP